MARTYRKDRGQKYRDGKPPRYRCRCERCTNEKRRLKGGPCLKEGLEEYNRHVV